MEGSHDGMQTGWYVTRLADTVIMDQVVSTKASGLKLLVYEDSRRIYTVFFFFFF